MQYWFPPHASYSGDSDLAWGAPHFGRVGCSVRWQLRTHFLDDFLLQLAKVADQSYGPRASVPSWALVSADAPVLSKKQE